MWTVRDGEVGALSFARLAHTLQEASAQALKTTADRPLFAVGLYGRLRKAWDRIGG